MKRLDTNTTFSQREPASARLGAGDGAAEVVLLVTGGSMALAGEEGTVGWGLVNTSLGHWV